jgi:hypothetical protein
MSSRALWLYVGVQAIIPLVALVVRWLVEGGACQDYGWQMYACG